MNVTWQDVEARFAELRADLTADRLDACEQAVHEFVRVVAPGAFLPPVTGTLYLNGKGQLATPAEVQDFLRSKGS